MPDAIIIGAGPNGLTAAITLAQAGVSVAVYEAEATPGGGARTAALTLPGFRHDLCSAVHPLAAGSPVLRALPLAEHGLTWVHPDLPLAHPFPDGSAAILARSPQETAASLGGPSTASGVPTASTASGAPSASSASSASGASSVSGASGVLGRRGSRHPLGGERDTGRGDRRAYLHLVRPFAGRWDELAPDLLRAPLSARPAHPAMLARFGAYAALPGAALARRFRGERARALIAGLAAHTTTPLTTPLGGGVALAFALAGHAVGWPFPRGGAQALTDALVSLLRSLGGHVTTGQPVRSLAELPAARAYLFDTDPAQLAVIAGDRLPPRYAQQLARRPRGPAAFKIDYALSGPVPWTAPECHRAGTVHLGASLEEIGTSLRAVHRGQVSVRPFLIVAQPSRFDDTRAPAGSHVLWVYGHVPNGWTGDLTGAIERQLERFAPGFGTIVLDRAITTPAALHARNRNDVGGDLSGGAGNGLRLVFRPTYAPVPYATPGRGIYLCSASTPPGPGVHGMCGYHAAHVALHRTFGIT